MGKLFDFKLVFTQIPRVIPYLPITMEIALISFAGSLLIGFVVAIVKIKQIRIIAPLVGFYVSFTRGTPVLVQLYLTYYGIPMFLEGINQVYGTAFNTNGIAPILFALVALAFNEGAYASESIRAAIESVDKGQMEAALSIGMTTFQALRRIILPEALVVALPSLGNSFIGLIKGTSLVFVTAVVEMTAAGKLMASRNFRYFEMYITLAIVYWMITSIVSRLLHWGEKRLRCNERQVPDDVTG
ncbi:MAG: amino acid ABC transporter permease [Treponema sp.]|jgi:polar amino acid transport system permease protein|nr:amino acid ABC transporter permease [Treponema sp.]